MPRSRSPHPRSARGSGDRSIGRATLRLARCLAIGAAVGVLTTACNRLDHTDVESIEIARRYEANGDIESAIVEAKAALQANQNNVDARLLLANLYLRRGRGVEAEIELKRAVDLGYDANKLVVENGRAMLLQGDYTRLLSTLVPQESAEVATQARVQELRGEAYLALGQLPNATAAFDKSLELAPGNVEVLAGKGQVALLENRVDAAASLVGEAASIAPKDLQVMFLKAAVEKAQRKPDSALATYQQILELYPNNALALTSATYILIVSDRFDEASTNIAVLQRYSNSAASANYLQGLLEYRRKNFVAARDAVQKALVAAPNHLPSVMLAGTTAFSLGSYETAERLLRQVVSAAPGTIYARVILVSTLLKLNRPKEAIDILAPVLGPDADARLLTLAGEAYLDNKDYGKAIDLLSRAAALDPGSTGTRLRLGVSRLASGQYDLAMSDLEDAVRTDTKGYQADFVLILARLRQGEFAEALRASEALQKRAPDNPMTYNLLGGAKLALKDATGARAAFEQALTLEPTFVPAAMNLARLDVAEGHPDAAKSRLEGVVAKDPKNVEALVALAGLLVNLKAPESDALALLERARVADPGAVAPRLLLARGVLGSDPKRAIVVAREAYAIDANNPAVLDVLGQAQIAVGESSGALATYNRLVELRPRSSGARIRLASLYQRNGNAVAAIRELQAAVAIDASLEARILLIDAQVKAGQTSEALKGAQEVQKQQPSLAAGYALEGDALIAQGKALPAAAAYEKAYKLGANNLLAMKLHAAYTAGNRAAEADAVLQRWLKVAPDDVDLRGYYANFAMRKGQYPVAIAQYEYILGKKPDSVVALNDLAWIYGQSGDGRAIELARHAYRLQPGDPHVADTFGWILVERGQMQEGIDVLKKAAVTAPEVVALRMHLGQAYVKAGDKASARQQFDYVASVKVTAEQRKAAMLALQAIEE